MATPFNNYTIRTPYLSSTTSVVQVAANSTDVYFATNNAIYRIDGAGTQTTIIPSGGLSFPNPILTIGVSPDGTTLIAVCNGNVAYITISNSAFVKYSFDNFAINIIGNIYTTSTNSFYMIGLNNLGSFRAFGVTNGTTTIASPDIPTFSPRSIGYDGTTYAYTISGGNNIIRYILGDTITSLVTLSYDVVPTYNLTDLMYVGGELYLADVGGNLYRYSISGTSLIFMSTINVSLNFQSYTIAFSSTGGTNTLRFYYSVPDTGVNKIYANSGGTNIGGDPHIKPIFGTKYMLPNNEKCYRLFDNLQEGDNRLVINTKCWFLPQNYLDDHFNKFRDENVLSWLKSYTYMRYLSIINGKESIVIDMESLKCVEYTNDIDVDSFLLKEINDTYVKTIKIGEIVESDKGLWSITHNKYIHDGKTYERTIYVVNDDCCLELVLSMTVDINDKNNVDKNNISVKLKGNRELNEDNYIGALISQKECQISGLMDLSIVKQNDY